MSHELALGLLGGFGAGAIDAAINTHAAVQYSARVVNVLHAFYAVGAAAGPALLTATLASGHRWQDGYRIIVALEVALGIVFVATRRLWPRASHTHESQRPAKLTETLKLGKVQVPRQPSRLRIRPLSEATRSTVQASAAPTRPEDWQTRTFEPIN